MSICKYSLKEDGDVRLSAHFNIYEFSSTSPNPYKPLKTYTDAVIIDDELINKLEQLINIMGATKCKISSGYRTAQHDKDVGGNGCGEHTKGTAVDCAFYKGNKIIRTDIVSLFAQNVGFNGIARISDKYIHLDTRKNSRYLGDETKSNNTVTSDFFEYFKFLVN